MSITERTLRKWRSESLKVESAVNVDDPSMVQTDRKSLTTWHERILRMTQELLDQHLLRKETR